MSAKDRLKSLLKNEIQRPLIIEEIMDFLHIENPDEITELQKVLDNMVREGELVLTKKMKYMLPEELEMYTGVIRRHPKGFAFLTVDDPDIEDIYIASKDLNGALNNDKVMVQLNKRQFSDARRKEGTVIKIVERHSGQVVGTFENSKAFGFVVPDDQKLGSDIFISKKDFNGARTGMKVIVEITKWPENGRKPEGKVVEVLGHKDDPGMDIISIIHKYNLPEQFPLEVLESAARIPEKISAKDIKGRVDLRDILMITIDGEDAKDLDDAVTVEVLENGLYRLGVHIADVGHYVLENSILDKEAFERATSVYLVDRVIPMLPQRLSNGICSLNAGEDRLAMTCFMDIDDKGAVVSHEICESVIHVDYRMTYTNVTKILVDQDEALLKKYEEIVPMLKDMEKLCGILRAKRLRRGAIDFDFPDSKVILDKKGKPIEIKWRERQLADQIIEEFMLSANETVAEHYFWLEVPFIYRVHEEPDPEDVNDVNNFLHVFGYSLKGANNTIHPKAYQAVVDAINGKKEERAISSVLLRSMQHARYADEALGHFGLSAKYYSHFTSPIRRYPDLAIHRVIKEMIKNGEELSEKRLKSLAKNMDKYAEQSSIRERVAEEAERESVDLKKIEYMKQYLGEIFEGVISGVTGFGLFVELDNSVEGLVHISTLQDDYYEYHSETYSLIGEMTKKLYQIGQRVTVQLVKVNVPERQIDFELINPEEEEENNIETVGVVPSL